MSTESGDSGVNCVANALDSHGSDRALDFHIDTPGRPRRGAADGAFRWRR